MFLTLMMENFSSNEQQTEVVNKECEQQPENMKPIRGQLHQMLKQIIYMKPLKCLLQPKWQRTFKRILKMVNWERCLMI